MKPATKSNNSSTTDDSETHLDDVSDDAPVSFGIERSNVHDDRKRKALSRAGFNWELANKVLKLIASGKSLTWITAQKGLPLYESLHRWVQNNELFAKKFREARNMYYERMADELIDIVDNPNTKGESQSGTKEKIWRDRLRAEQRQWILSRVLPKMYGTRPIDPETASKISADLLSIIKTVTDIAAGKRSSDVLEGEFVELTDATRDAPWKPSKKQDDHLLEEGQKLGESVIETDESSTKM